MRPVRGLVAGAVAGAAGTTALNAVTYLDMVLRARPASGTPETTVQKMADLAGVQIPGDDEQRKNRVAGLGPLSGLAVGVGVGAVLGVGRAAGCRPGLFACSLAAAAAALVGSNGPMTVLGVTDPRRWSAVDWVSDLVPHLIYGVVTAAALQGLDPAICRTSRRG
ncbi:MAG: hypothetical protein M3017_03050 [Actinomycetota bacterium]|nr:hypothetical protein [Actinomycetota bacterium]